MKQGIHPQWYPEAHVRCASCGTTYIVGATKPEIQVDICSHCHPFFTGEMKFLDTLGRVEKFQAKQQVGSQMAAKLADKKKKKKEREESLRSPKSLKDMLMGIQ